MGFLKDIGNAFNGNARKKYDTTHNQMIDILNNNTNSNILYSGYSLHAEQKLVAMLFINGCFNGLSLMYDISNGENDIEESMKKASSLAQLFMEDKLKWSKSDVRRTVEAIDNMLYQRPQLVQNMVNTGMGVVLNIQTSPSIAKLMGYTDISQENGYKILNEFFEMLLEG